VIKSRLLYRAPCLAFGRFLIIEDTEANLCLYCSQGPYEAVPQVWDRPQLRRLTGDLHKNWPLFRLHAQLSFIETLGCDNLGATRATADQFGHHVLQARGVPAASGIVQPIVLDVNSIALQHALNESVGELCNRIDTS
jgi:hypothetical protein